MTPSQKLFAYALRLLTRRCYSTVDLKKKLELRQQKWNVGTSEDIEAVIEKLKQLKYLDDRNFARIFTESTLRQKPQGKKLLELRLKQKGINSSLISETLLQQNLDEVELATLASQKKMRMLHEMDPLKRKSKLYRFLLSRGFSHQVSMEVIRNSIYNSASS